MAQRPARDRSRCANGTRVRRARLGRVLLASLLVWLASLVPGGDMAWQPAIADPAPGRILAPANRQLAWLDLDAPRPRLLTRFEPPAYVTDVAALPGAQVAVIAVSMAAVPLPTAGPTPAPVTASAAVPFPTSLGSDLLSVDLTSGQVSTLVARGDAHESLGAPAWQGGGSSVLFERQDQSSPGLAYAGVSTVSYPTRIEMVQPDGSGRMVLVQDGRQPTAAPDGGSIAFLRTSADGSALMLRTTSDGSERVLVPIGQFRDLASPRYSPQGDQLAFMAPGTFVGLRSVGLLGTALFGTSVALAHGFPWDVWLIGADGSGMRLLAQLGADDGTVSWSPDGSQVFVYGGSGSFVVDVATGEVTSLGYVAGYGSTAWLPLQVGNNFRASAF